VADIGRHGVANGTDATVLYRGITPCVVSELGIDRNCNHFHAQRFKSIHTMIECDQFGRAHKGEVQRIEEYQAVFAFDGFAQRELIDYLAIAQYGANGKIGSRFTNEYAHYYLASSV